MRSLEKIHIYLRTLMKWNPESTKAVQVLVLFDGNDALRQFQNSELNPAEPFFSFTAYPIALLARSYSEIRTLIKRPDVLWVEIDALLYLQLNEVHASLKTSMIYNSLLEFHGKDVLIGVVDSGIDQTHPDLEGKVIQAVDYTEEGAGDSIGHGTMVASAICGTGQSSRGLFRGLAPGAQLIDYKIFNKSGITSLSNFLACLEDIIEDLSVIKCDILYLPFSAAVIDFGRNLLNTYIERLVDAGLLVVSCTGNFGPDPNTISYPGSCPEVLTIGAHTSEYTMSFFSGRGGPNYASMKPDFVMKGTKIVSAVPSDVWKGTRFKQNQNYAVISGTSIAGALGVGSLAIIKEAFPQITNVDLKTLLSDHALSLTRRKFSEGNGILDPLRILEETDRLYPKPLPYSALVRKSLKYGAIIFFLLMGTYSLLYLLFSTNL